MRWVYGSMVALFGLAALVFALQNFELVTMSFLGFNARMPLALLALIAYGLGALTGGSVFALLRQSYEKSRGPQA